MNLVDVMVGGLVFSLASVSSLHIYGSSLRWAQGHEHREQVAADLEIALTEASRQLWQQVASASEESRTGNCSTAAEELESALKATPGTSGISREVVQQGELVSVTVKADGLPQRRRWFAPAAYGLCGELPMAQSSAISPLVDVPDTP